MVARIVVKLSIAHLTRYRYRKSVTLNPHRLMVRPRESRLLQVSAFDLRCDPPARIEWGYDVFGNAIASASFADPATVLSIECRVELQHAEEAWPVFAISASAINYPFAYSADEPIDLGALKTPHYPDPIGRVCAWARNYVAPGSTDTLSLLKDLNAGVFACLTYEVREDYGTQSPLQSLDRGMGSCRDFATLLVEAARHLGFGARTVSGYLWDPGNDAIGSAGPGSTHAWSEIYVPGAGWITFDPTNQAVGAGRLIPVAVARTIEQIAPVTGGFQGDVDDHLDMSVSVTVAAI